jgi:Arc/MetJ family transcription regulator
MMQFATQNVMECAMRTTVTIDEELYIKALSMRADADKLKTSQLVNEALRALIRQEAAANLSVYRGSVPDMALPIRNR